MSSNVLLVFFFVLFIGDECTTLNQHQEKCEGINHTYRRTEKSKHSISPIVVYIDCTFENEPFLYIYKKFHSKPS